MELGERTGPNPGLEFGFGERTWPNTGSAVRSLEKRPGLTLDRGKACAEPWFGLPGVPKGNWPNPGLAGSEFGKR